MIALNISCFVTAYWPPQQGSPLRAQAVGGAHEPLMMDEETWRLMDDTRLLLPRDCLQLGTIIGQGRNTLLDPIYHTIQSHRPGYAHVIRTDIQYNIIKSHQTQYLSPMLAMQIHLNAIQHNTHEYNII